MALDLSASAIRDVTRIASLVQRENPKYNRDMFHAFRATENGLEKAAISIAGTDIPKIGIMTGCYINGADQAGTNGPLATALFAFALSKLGMNCQVITDGPCAAVCRAALDAVGAVKVALDIVADESDLPRVTSQLVAGKFTHLIAVERPGANSSGNSYDMNGDVIKKCVPFDRLFLDMNIWTTIGIGDDGRELGMGSLPFYVVAHHSKNRMSIACTTPADIVITGGVSNFALYGLMSAMGIVRPEWHQTMIEALKLPAQRKVLNAMVAAGAVDGITKRNEATVDGLSINDTRPMTAVMVRHLKKAGP